MVKLSAAPRLSRLADAGPKKPASANYSIVFYGPENSNIRSRLDTTFDGILAERRAPPQTERKIDQLCVSIGIWPLARHPWNSGDGLFLR